MNKYILSVLLIFFSLNLLSCSTSIQEYKNDTPALKLENFFEGKLMAHGLYKDRFNKVSKRFVVTMFASWKGAVGTLDEDFVYSDGSKSKRIWTLTKISDTEYLGTASDVIGQAHGIISGNSLLWNYDLKLAVDKKEYIVHFEDWMYLIDNNNMINQSYMSKFKINLGQVVLSIQKVK